MTSEKSVMLVIRAARPSFRNCHDKAAFAVHAAFVASGYILHTTGLPAYEDGILSSCPVTDEVGMENWNEIEDYYGFVYSHPDQGSKRVLMKGIVLNEKLFVDVLKEGDYEQPHHLEVNTMEYVENGGGTNYGSQFKNLAKLVAGINKELLSKLNGSSSTSASFSNQPMLSTTNEINNGLQIGYPCPHFFPQPIFIGPPTPWSFGGRPAAGTLTMPNGPHPRNFGESWRRPLSPGLQRNVNRSGGSRARGRGRKAESRRPLAGAPKI